MSSPRGVRTAARVIVPAALLWLAVVGVGLLLSDLDEHAISVWFVEQRTATLDAVTHVVSSSADTMMVIAFAVLVSGFVLWRTHRWRLAAVPLLALALEAVVFLTSSAVVARDRPEVFQLDHAPPTSSFPSGHTGAATSVWVAILLLATTIRHRAVRVIVMVVCTVMPLAVALSRVYRGMHHPTDVVAGLLVGTACALIAWNALRVRDAVSSLPAPTPTSAPGRSSTDRASDALATRRVAGNTPDDASRSVEERTRG